MAAPGITVLADFEAFRANRLVGTVADVRVEVQEWEALGVDTLILGVGAVPFHVGALDDIEMLAAALMP